MLEEIDAIVVMVVDHFGEIKELLERKVNCPILPMETLIYETENLHMESKG